MREHWQRMLTLTVMLLVSLISAVPVRAETVEAVFRKGSGNYTFTIGSDHLLELNSPDIGKTYGSAILFRNDTDADMKVTLASTEELTSGTEDELYAIWEKDEVKTIFYVEPDGENVIGTNEVVQYQKAETEEEKANAVLGNPAQESQAPDVENAAETAPAESAAGESE